MFSKKITHPAFKSLQRGLFSYSGVADLAGHQDVAVSIKGRSNHNFEVALAEIEYLGSNLRAAVAPASQDFFGTYEAVKDAVLSEALSLEDAGGELPELKSPEEVWKHLALESVAIEPDSQLSVRLGFRAPWEVEHDLGLYLKDREFQYAGVSV